MWEVRGTPREFDQLLQWVCEVAVPGIEAHYAHISSEVFASTDHRVVVISKWRGEPGELPTPPESLTARSAHSWDFAPVDR